MAANYILINEQTLNASASSVTFSSIPQTGYTDLVIKVSARNNQSAYDDGYSLSVNGGTSYTTMELYAQNGSVGSYGPRTGPTYLFLGHVPSVNSTANTFGSTDIYIPNYTSTGVKTVSIDGTTENNGSQVYQVLYAGSITNGAAISSITIDSLGYNFVAGSSFSLYGVAAVGTTPTVVPKASGGDIVVNDGTYWYHAFLSSGNFVPQTTLSADVLVVAGGGGGSSGGYSGGAGGAGGVFYSASTSLTSQSYTCTIGSGGAAVVSNNGSNGGNSKFGVLTTAVGGGGGGGGNDAAVHNGVAGGSGGGGASDDSSGGGVTSGGAGTSGQGYAGSGNAGYASPAYPAGSGGGAGGAGNPPTGYRVAGNGGVGLNTWSSWATATGTGDSGYFAGGGGGSIYSEYGGGNTRGLGGSGGGGAGAIGTSVASSSGKINTGGGGGGGGEGAAGAGGSGIIIVRYAM